MAQRGGSFLLSWSILVPLLVGLFTVLQGTFNRLMGDQMGLAAAILLNAGILLMAAGGLFILVWYYPQLLPGFGAAKLRPPAWSWWYIVPGLCGFGIVLGVPLAISRLGALPTFAAIIAAQLLFSLIWDITIAQVPVSPQRIIGVLCTMAGTLLNLWRPS